MPPDQSNINNSQRTSTCIFIRAYRHSSSGLSRSLYPSYNYRIQGLGTIFDIYDNAWGKIMRCLPGAECRVNAEIQN